MTDTVKQGPRLVDSWEVLNLLEQVTAPILETYPDYVYEPPQGSCVNLVKDGEDKWVGSCMVGRAFIELGLEPDSEWAEGSFGYVAHEYARETLKFTEEARWVLSTAQNLQDGKMPWKHVLDAVNRGHGNLYLVDKTTEA